MICTYTHDTVLDWRLSTFSRLTSTCLGTIISRYRKRSTYSHNSIGTPKSIKNGVKRSIPNGCAVSRASHAQTKASISQDICKISLKSINDHQWVVAVKDVSHQKTLILNEMVKIQMQIEILLNFHLPVKHNIHIELLRLPHCAQKL